MLTSVDVTNAGGDTINFSVLDTSNGYSVREILGLDPVKATLTTSSMAQVDGAQFQNSRRDMRNILMKLGLEPNYAVSTVQSLRSDLYNYLMPKEFISLAFYIDNVLAYTASGQVESFENAMFSADPEVNISILCYDPDFYGPDELVISDVSQMTPVVVPIEYAGTSDAGIIFSFNMDKNLDDLTITNTIPGNVNQKMEVIGSFVDGDVVTINTIPGQKAITLTREGITTSILYGLVTAANWIFFEKGTNYFSVSASNVGTAYTVPYTLTYTPKFGGI